MLLGRLRVCLSTTFFTLSLLLRFDLFVVFLTEHPCNAYQSETHLRTQHGEELCLLALDGGGVRRLSSLCILDELMRKADNENPPNPYDYFDLIGGTSTGGLIAVMLGRLGMTIDECRHAYLDLAAEAFELKNHPAKPMWGIPWKWELNARFNTEALECGMKRIIRRALRRDPAIEMLLDTELENALLKDNQVEVQSGSGTWPKSSRKRLTEHATAVARFASLNRPSTSESCQTTTWLENMPQVRTWTHEAFNPLCYLDRSESQMSNYEKSRGRIRDVGI
ncbi:FabD/lysophospholipase-like protein [Macroventuria anomochaeta]|uniref:FabD/lysophospholipase-like protein n=1 Tax=Macroventuria anomochaeta TaxID=301207 RepID=A0ACB6RRC7_9PLEO|nr:FabD/lysophospholipase-like protein [Macroventuria anomochaeta]KAF2623699.1 FabD/lysophospholipase-like protein [Macroventuria anomochaeta]